MRTRDEAFADLLNESHRRLLGEPLVPADVPAGKMAEWLYDAPFGLLVHDGSDDPVFIYANQTAQKLFEYSWDEFVGLPSRLSAGEEDREERRILLEGVREKGFTTAYRGPRVARSGRRFFIDEVTVWNLALDSGSVRTGQGALIRRWEDG